MFNISIREKEPLQVRNNPIDGQRIWTRLFTEEKQKTTDNRDMKYAKLNYWSKKGKSMIGY